MKKFILSAAILATLASCNYNNTIATNYEAIQFGNAFVDNNVRATDPSYSGTKELTDINVYGAINGTVNIFNATPVGGNVGDATWTIKDGTTQYWIEGADYEFAAVADVADLTTDVVANAGGIPTSLKYDAASQDDILYAYLSRNDVAAPYSVVDFSFKHLLSKVNVTFKNTTAGDVDDYNIDVKDIKITNPYKSATYEITNNSTNGTWSGAWNEDSAVVDANYATEFGDILDVKNGKDATIETEMLLIPTTQDLTITFTVDICNGDDVITSTPYSMAITTDLLQGCSYNVTISQSLGTKIQFTVSENPEWLSGTNPGEIVL